MTSENSQKWWDRSGADWNGFGKSRAALKTGGGGSPRRPCHDADLFASGGGDFCADFSMKWKQVGERADEEFHDGCEMLCSKSGEFYFAELDFGSFCLKRDFSGAGGAFAAMIHECAIDHDFDFIALALDLHRIPFAERFLRIVS